MIGAHSPQTVDVLIVGAGLSGLSAARTLTDAGLTTVAIEARDRVGGRTLAHPLNNGVFGIGGQFVGPGQKRIEDLAQELGVELRPMYSKSEKWDSVSIEAWKRSAQRRGE